MDDIRLAVSFRRSRKRRKLERILGPAGVLALVDLWIGVAESRPDGELHGWTEEDIALEADWPGNPHEFVDALVKCGLLEKNEHYMVHDWAEHQPWVVGKQDRVEKARNAARARWDNREEVLGNAPTCPKDARSINEQCHEHPKSNAPFPTFPNPSTPTPSEEKKLTTSTSESEAFSKRDLPQEYLDYAKDFQNEVTRRCGNTAPKITDAMIAECAAVVDKLIRLDGFSLETIRTTLLWGIEDSFWSRQVRSLRCLRKVSDSNGLTKFQNLVETMKKRGSAPRAMQTTGFNPASPHYPKPEELTDDHYRF